MSTLPTLPFELYDSRRETAQIGNGVGERRWLCLWMERKSFTGCPIKGHSLYTEGTEDEGMGTEADRLVCESINYKGKGAGSVVGAYTLPFNMCEVTATYRERQGFGGNCLENYKGTVRFLNVGGEAVWDDGLDTPCEFPVQRAFPQGTLVIPLYFIYHSGIRASLDALQCKLNSTSWLDIIGGGMYDAETVRFDSYTCDEMMDEVWGRLSKITYYISINPLNWNLFPSYDGTMMRRIPDVYTTANLNGLFTVATRVV